MILHKDVPHGTWDYPFQVHRTELSNGLYLYPHAHEEIEVTCITSGKGIFCVNGRDYSVKAGDIVFIEPNSIHLADKTDDDPCSFFSVVFSWECISASKESRLYTKFIAPVLEGRIRFAEIYNGSEEWHNELRFLLNEMDKYYNEEENELICQARLLDFWNLLYKNGSIEEGACQDIHINKLRDSIDYMHSNFGKHVTINELAGIAHMSAGHFIRVFHEYMKMTPIDYLVHIRIHEAEKMLMQSDMSIGEISLMCGFNDFSYFGQKFKKETGFSPRRYRHNSNSI